jgi:glutathione S-transferase
MELFFSPLACSLASRIALYEAGASATFIEVDPKTKKTSSGFDYLTINPLGLVPALRTDSGELLLENAAVFQYIADQCPGAMLARGSGMARSRLQQWLSFIGTELHKGLFIPLFDKALADTTKSKTMEIGAKRIAYLSKHLEGREYLLDRYSVADTYLTTVLNWNIATPVDLKQWPTIDTYFKRMSARPATAQAMKEEFALYAEEQKRHKAA